MKLFTLTVLGAVAYYLLNKKQDISTDTHTQYSTTTASLDELTSKAYWRERATASLKEQYNQAVKNLTKDGRLSIAVPSFEEWKELRHRDPEPALTRAQNEAFYKELFKKPITLDGPGYRYAY